jgi:hypothetical protein
MGFVCVACYRSASKGPGICRDCGVARLPLDNPQVLEDLRAEAERRVQKRLYREYSVISVVSFLLTSWLFPIQILFLPVWWILAGLGLTWVGTSI